MKKRILWSILIVAIIALAVLLAAFEGGIVHIPSRNNTSPQNSQVIASKDLDSSLSYQFFEYKKGVLFQYDNELSYYDKNLKNKWTITTGISSPLISVRGDYILVAAHKGKDVKLYKKNKEIVSFENTSSILGAEVNENGYFVLISEEKGYKGKLSVYTSSGKEIHQWFSGSKYIIDAAVSPNNKNIMLSLLDLSSPNIKGNVLFLKTGETAPVASYEYEDNATSKVYYYDDGSSAVLGDSAMIFYTGGQVQKHSIPFNGRTLENAHIENPKNIVLALTGERGSSIQIYNRSGYLKGEYIRDDTIHIFDAQKGYTALNKGRSIVLLNTKGQEVASVLPSKEVKKILLFSDKDKILVSSAISAEVMKFGR